MISQLKQFVPSNVCLKCDGCCRFQLSDSPWRPKTGQMELQEGIDEAGYLKTVKEGNHHQCVFFNKIDHTCQVYSKRPFECESYPFVVSKENEDIKVYMHLACPYIQDREVSVELQDYVVYLKGFFKESSTKMFLS